jgi:hypothetical protein
MSIRVTKDGRTIRTGKHYADFRFDLYQKQGAMCNCGRMTSLYMESVYDSSFHVHHVNGRGGGKRDDTLEACEGLCGRCHRIKHGQQSAVPSDLKWSRT